MAQLAMVTMAADANPPDGCGRAPRSDYDGPMAKQDPSRMRRWAEEAESGTLFVVAGSVGAPTLDGDLLAHAAADRWMVRLDAAVDDGHRHPETPACPFRPRSRWFPPG